jgi:hypothetical protein
MNDARRFHEDETVRAGAGAKDADADLAEKMPCHQSRGE